MNETYRGLIEAAKGEDRHKGREAALNLYRIVATYLRARHPMPEELADFIAERLEVIVSEPTMGVRLPPMEAIFYTAEEVRAKFPLMSKEDVSKALNSKSFGWTWEDICGYVGKTDEAKLVKALCLDRTRGQRHTPEWEKEARRLVAVLVWFAREEGRRRGMRLNVPDAVKLVAEHTNCGENQVDAWRKEYPVRAAPEK